MEFHVYETREPRAGHRPLVFITSNNEKDCPDAFLRRCFFHYIVPRGRDDERDRRGAFPGLRDELLGAALKAFFDIRSLPGHQEEAPTSELIDWIRLLLAEDILARSLQGRAGQQVAVPPLVGALLKNEQDIALFEKLVMMNQSPLNPSPVHPSEQKARHERDHPPRHPRGRHARLVPLSHGHPTTWWKRSATASSGGSGTPRSRRRTAWRPRSSAASACTPRQHAAVRGDRDRGCMRAAPSA